METNYIGIDVHVKFCQFAIVDDLGKQKFNMAIPTEPRVMQQFIQKVPRPRKAIMEMSSMSEWLVRLLEPHLDELAVCDARQNHWICASDDSTDPQDAYKLAQLLRGGFYKSVHLPTVQRQQFRELVQDYHRLTRQEVRLKNQIKAKYRARGLRQQGEQMYAPATRQQWVEQLDARSRQTTMEAYYRMLDTALEERARLLQRMRWVGKSYPELKLLQTVPGVGFITAATFFALVDTPWRFPDKEHLWSYCRLGVKDKISAGKRKGGGQKGGSRQLKSVLIESAHVAISRCKKQTRFRLMHQRLMQAGKDPRVAIRTVARSICSTLYGIWKSGEPYREPEMTTA